MPAKAGTQDRRHRGGGPWVPACGNVIQFKAGGLTASGPKTTVRISPLMRSVGELATSKRAQRRQKCHFPNARMALANWITAPCAGMTRVICDHSRSALFSKSGYQAYRL